MVVTGTKYVQKKFYSLLQVTKTAKTFSQNYTKITLRIRILRGNVQHVHDDIHI